MKSITLVCVLAALLFSSVTFAADDPKAMGKITGTITGSDGKPAAGAPVKLYNAKVEQSTWGRSWITLADPAPQRPGANAVVETTTDANGAYTLANVPPGTYRLIGGVAFKEMAFANVTLRAGQSLTLNLTLKGRRVG